METSKWKPVFFTTRNTIVAAIFFFIIVFLEITMNFLDGKSNKVKLTVPPIMPRWKHQDNSTVKQHQLAFRSNTSEHDADYVKKNKLQNPDMKINITNYKTVLFWTTLVGNEWFNEYDTAPFSSCPVNNCTATRDQSLLKSADAVVIYFFDLSKHNFPDYYHPRQRWVFHLNEPASHTFLKVKSLRGFNNFFNWTMTYRLDSDIPTPYVSLFKRAAAVEYKTNVAQRKTKFATWFATRCDTKSRREAVVQKLKEYFTVDVFGRSGRCDQIHCKDCNWDDMLNNQYKFYLAFENGLCRDYVTEKLHRGLTHDIIPVVFGAVNYSKYAPPHSYINVFDFQTTKHLADYLLLLDKNDTLYNQYFEWKKHYIIQQNGINPWCTLCSKLNDPDEPIKTYANLRKWWIDDANCMTFIDDENGQINLAPTFEVHKYSGKGIS